MLGLNLIHWKKFPSDIRNEFVNDSSQLILSVKIDKRDKRLT